MVAVSDAVLVLVSATVLGAGLLHWQNNVDKAISASQRPVNSAQINQQPLPASVPAEQNILVAQREPITSANSFAAEQANYEAPADQTNGADSGSSAPTVPANDGNGTVSPALNAPLYGDYFVQSGDSLSQIAEQYSTSVSVLQELNGLNGTVIRIGQQLQYPLPAN